MKQAIIHIGVHKTGTTSIQNWMWENRAHILSAYGWEYPTEFAVQNAHHVIPWSVMPAFEENPISRPHRIDLARLKAMMQKHDRVVLSSEPFCMAGEGAVDAVRDIFEGFETTVVIYARRQDRLVQSEYVQRVKQEVSPLTTPFSDFTAMWRRWLPAFDFYALYKRWESRFGRVIVKDFDASARSGIIRSFLEVIGAEASAPAEEKPENTSLNYHYIAALREANILEGMRPGARAALIKKMEGIEFPSGKPSFFRGPGAQRYMEHFLAGNERLARESQSGFTGFDGTYPYVMPHHFVDTESCRYMDWFQRVLG